MKQVQHEDFFSEIRSAQNGTRVPPQCPLRHVSLHIDEDVILRVEGRLQRSQGTYGEKHPIVLPKTHYFTILVIRRCHQRVLHSRVRDTLAQLREEYWVASGRQLVKKTIKNCVTCQRFTNRSSDKRTVPLP